MGSKQQRPAHASFFMELLRSNHGVLWAIACQARDRAVARDAEDERAFNGDALTAVVMAALTTEAFINDIAASFAFHRDGVDHLAQELPQISESIPAWMRLFAGVMTDAVASNVELRIKYQIAAQILDGHRFDTGENPYQDFNRLVVLRNTLAHLKPEQVDLEKGSTGQSLYIFFRDKGMTRNHPTGFIRGPDGNLVDVPRSGVSDIQTGAVATWACTTARGIIEGLCSKMADDQFVRPLLPWN
jgi:hypothetical protein